MNSASATNTITIPTITATATSQISTPFPTIEEPSPTPQSSTSAQPLDDDLTEIIKEILLNPEANNGKKILIIGNYQGWNLFGKATGQSPVTRSDWVIQDKSGAIYVQAGVVDGVALTSGNSDDMKKILRIVGFVRLSPTNQPYIEPIQIEIIR